MGDDDGYEIMNMETYSGGNKNQEFSHQALVMSALSRASISLSREMRAGFWNEKLDKFGNVIRSYMEDTRLNFIESVKSAEINMCCDYDEESLPNLRKIEELKKEIETVKAKYLKQEAEEWKNLPTDIRQLRMREGIIYRSNILHPKLPFLNEFIMEKVRIYEDIFRQLILVTSNKDFYESARGSA